VEVDSPVPREREAREREARERGERETTGYEPFERERDHARIVY